MMTVHRWSARSYLALSVEIKGVILEFEGMGLQSTFYLSKIKF
jgi:hypothetical protein